MSSILDIDLDYFGLLDDPAGELDRLVRWAGRPVDAVVERHHHAFRAWREALRKAAIDEPRFILHVDEHHDMLGEVPPVNLGNFMLFAMNLWPRCRVHWLVRDPIDSPDQWLSDEAWSRVRRRFTSGPRVARGWPRPDRISVATSPGFVEPGLARELVRRLGRKTEPQQRGIRRCRQAASVTARRVLLAAGDRRDMVDRMGHSRKPGAPGRTTIPPDIVSSATDKILAVFRRFGFDEDYQLFVVPQQCYLYLEARCKRPEDRGPPPPVTRSSTTHKPLGRLKFLGKMREWEYHPYLWSDEGWDTHDFERGTLETIVLGVLAYKL